MAADPVEVIATAPRPPVGGPWEDFVSCSKASIARLLRQGVPKTKSSRASWLEGHQEVDEDERITRLEFVDLYTIAVAALLAPLTAAVYVAFLVLSMPALALLRLYIATQWRPTHELPQTSAFRALGLLLWVLALPCDLVVGVYWLVLFPTLVVSSGFYALLSLKLSYFSANMALLQSCNHWPQWTWTDLVTALVGVMDRQGFAKLLLKLPSAVLVVPVLKYLFGANPLLYRLSIRRRNMWTSSLAVEDNKAVAAVVQAVSWPLAATTLLQPEEPVAKFKSDRVVSGHIPFPLTDRGDDARTGLGVLTSNGLVTVVNAQHNVNGSIFHSMTAKRSIFNVLLYSWNPCHYLTGYAEVNLQHDGAIEQPMWCVVGDNFIGNWLFERADALFWHYDPTGTRGRELSLASTASYDETLEPIELEDSVSQLTGTSIAVLESTSEVESGSLVIGARDTISSDSFVV